MKTEGITLTMKETKTNDILVKLISKEIKIKNACRLTGLSERQIFRKKAKYLTEGIESIPHKNKNRKTGRGYSDKLKQEILTLYKDEYINWNFYHFNDTLEEMHNIKVSDSFIYNLLTSNDYSSPLKYKKHKKESHPPRPRRENAGELIQVDASKHQWFYEDDKYYHLHGAIDDATGIVCGCYFSKEETIYGYQMILAQTIHNYGIPECLYTDYRTVFQSPKQELTLEEELDGKKIENTKFTNMLNTMSISIISTTNPMAKGRIERLWKTFQNRLYNELKRLNINTLEKANEYLCTVFLPKYNARFALPIDNNKNSFICPLDSFDFNKDLAVWSEHKVYHNSYLKYNKHYHIILDNGEKVYLPTSDKVTVYTFVDGTDHILYQDKWYDLKAIKDFQVPVKEVIKNKKTQEEINKSKAHKPTNSPWSKGLPTMPNHSTSQWAFFNAC